MKHTELSSEQKLRYSRNILLEGFGVEKQIALLNASALIVGAGALGSVVAMYLAAAGVGKIGICDFDNIDVSNLQRQLSFTTDDIGKPKAEQLARKLRNINPDIKVEAFREIITTKNATEIIKGFDIVAEGSDNPTTKYLITDTVAALGKPCVLGGVAQYAGQVTTILPGGPTYRDLFPDSAGEGGYMPCSIGGVLGAVPGIVASVQAAEIIKVLTNTGTHLSGRLLTIDALSMQFREIRF